MQTLVLPEDTELERVILGAVLIREDLKLFETVRRELPDPAAFTIPFNREAFLAMCALVDRGDEINPLTLWKEMETRGSSVKPVDIPFRIQAMADGVPALSSLKSEIRRLKEVFTRREIIRCSDAWLNEAQARDVDVSALVATITRRAADFGYGAIVEASPIEISWAQLCEMEFPYRETILHEVERGEIVRCSAITNRGKTTLWRNATLSLVSGREFLPLVPCGPPRRVLYLDFETRLKRLRPDIMKMLGQLTQEQRALVGANLHIIADCFIDGYPLTLTNPKHIEIVEQAARRIQADVVIVDTLSAAFAIENENDNAEGTRIMKKLINMGQRLNCVIVFLDHIGKTKLEEGQTAQAVHRGRGASAYSGLSTAIFNLLPDSHSQERITLECAKVKGQRFDNAVMDLDKETRWFSSASVPVPAPSVSDRLLGVFNGQPLKRAAILTLLSDLSEDTVDRQLKTEVDAKNLIKQKAGREVEYLKNAATTDDTPHDPQPYRPADSADSRSLLDTEDTDWDSDPEKDLAEYSDDYHEED